MGSGGGGGGGGGGVEASRRQRNGLPASMSELAKMGKEAYFTSVLWNRLSIGEAKNPALLSRRDGYLWELTGWTQGSQAS